MEVTYTESGSIKIDNSELLAHRADVDIDKEFEGDRDGLGGMTGKEEDKLKRDKERTQWKEPSHKATDVKHKCPVCGTNYWGRPNKNYCCTPCKEVAKKRRQRKRKRDIREFKPHRGHAGEIYIMTEVKGKDVISFIPAFYGDTRARAKKYIEDTYTEDVRDNYYEQVKEVIRK